MNAKKLISMGITLAALSMLTACEAGPVTPGTPGTPASNQPGTPQTATSNATMNILPGEVTQAAIIPTPPTDTMQGPSIPTQQVSKTESDMVTFKTALEKNDAAYCDKIKDSQYVSECKTIVADQIALSAALAQLDSNLCSKLSTLDKQNSCKSQIEQNKLSQVKQQESDSILAKETEMYNQMSAQNDYSKCEELTNLTLKSTCLTARDFYDAVTKKDVKLCDKLLNSADRNSCINMINKQ